MFRATRNHGILKFECEKIELLQWHLNSNARGEVQYKKISNEFKETDSPREFLERFESIYDKKVIVKFLCDKFVEFLKDCKLSLADNWIDNDWIGSTSGRSESTLIQIRAILAKKIPAALDETIVKYAEYLSLDAAMQPIFKDFIFKLDIFFGKYKINLCYSHFIIDNIFQRVKI